MAQKIAQAEISDSPRSLPKTAREKLKLEVLDQLQKVIDGHNAIVCGEERERCAQVAEDFCTHKTDGKPCQMLYCLACAIATQLRYPLADIRRTRGSEPREDK